MAPEQLAGSGVSVRSDLYSLGLVLYEMFTGRRAFEGRSLTELQKLQRIPPVPPRALAPDIDPAVEEIILACLEVDPLKRRPESAGAVAAALVQRRSSCSHSCSRSNTTSPKCSPRGASSWSRCRLGPPRPPALAAIVGRFSRLCRSSGTREKFFQVALLLLGPLKFWLMRHRRRSAG